MSNPIEEFLKPKTPEEINKSRDAYEKSAEIEADRHNKFVGEHTKSEGPGRRSGLLEKLDKEDVIRRDANYENIKMINQELLIKNREQYEKTAEKKARKANSVIENLTGKGIKAEDIIRDDADEENEKRAEPRKRPNSYSGRPWH